MGLTATLLIAWWTSENCWMIVRLKNHCILQNEQSVPNPNDPMTTTTTTAVGEGSDVVGNFEQAESTLSPLPQILPHQPWSSVSSSSSSPPTSPLRQPVPSISTQTSATVFAVQEHHPSSNSFSSHVSSPSSSSSSIFSSSSSSWSSSRVLTWTYPDVAGYLYGRSMYRVTLTCVCVQQLAICTVFLSFTATNIYAIWTELTTSRNDNHNNNIINNNNNHWLVHTVILTCCLPIVLALVSLPNLKALAPVTAAGTILYLLGLGLLLLIAILVTVMTPHQSHAHEQHSLHNDTNSISDTSIDRFMVYHDFAVDDNPWLFPMQQSVSTTEPIISPCWTVRHVSSNSSSSSSSKSSWFNIPLALCALLYSFEGINLILPVENAMRKQSPYPMHQLQLLPHQQQHNNQQRTSFINLEDWFNQSSFVTVFCTAMIVATIIFITVGMGSFLVFGSVDNGSITAFVLTQYGHYHVIRFICYMANTAVTVSVLLTYPLQLFPCVELMEPLLSSATTAISLSSPQLHRRFSYRSHRSPQQGRLDRVHYGTTVIDDDDDDKDDDDNNENNDIDRAGHVTLPTPSMDDATWIHDSSHEGTMIDSQQDDCSHSLLNDNNEMMETAELFTELTRTTTTTTTVTDPLTDGTDTIMPASLSRHGLSVSNHSHGQNTRDRQIRRRRLRRRPSDSSDSRRSFVSSESLPNRTILYTLVLFTYLLAVIIPNVQSLISLAGALAGSSTALLIPPMLQLKWETRDKETMFGYNTASNNLKLIIYNHWRMIVYLLLGAVFLCIGTVASLFDISRAYSNS
jgi:hypothetical protein